MIILFFAASKEVPLIVGSPKSPTVQSAFDVPFSCPFDSTLLG